MAKWGGGGSLPPKSNSVQLLKGAIGGFFGILLLGYLGETTGDPWLMAPFGATCVLLFTVPSSPLAQPRNVIGGHLTTAAIGLLALYSLGDAIWVMALAVAISILLMQLLRTIHPPAGANPLLIILAGKQVVDVSFLLTPVLVGSVLLVILAALVNNWGRESWPVYWHGIRRQRREDEA
ncbi:HPP family protein [Serratia microhaemolytica]|uniref:HPP family protein n=1 Tax=Serratia microhaemolytica TaxID=2675110 RepID=UPI000FDDC5E8|nr:HPP family protein [Serratia microhaemolytica]